MPIWQAKVYLWFSLFLIINRLDIAKRWWIMTTTDYLENILDIYIKYILKCLKICDGDVNDLKLPIIHRFIQKTVKVTTRPVLNCYKSFGLLWVYICKFSDCGPFLVLFCIFRVPKKYSGNYWVAQGSFRRNIWKN